MKTLILGQSEPNMPLSLPQKPELELQHQPKNQFRRLHQYSHPNNELYKPQHISQVAQSLDFSAEPRLARGSDQEIQNSYPPNERTE
jgi:hypothetical protein